MVHPCGSGAFGYFETTRDVSDLTKVRWPGVCLLIAPSVLIGIEQANFLNGTNVKTPVFVRFSTVTLGREFPDSARNPRGFAIKFYTAEGNYDLVGLNFVSLFGQPLSV